VTPPAAASTAKIIFYEPWYQPDSGANIKILGQKRPSLYAAGADIVDTNMDTFLREKATYYAGMFSAFGQSEYAATRRDAALLALRQAENMLAQSPQVFRMKQGSIYVPGR